MNDHHHAPGELAQAMEDERNAEQAIVDKYNAAVQQEIDEFLASIQHDQLTPGEIDEIFRLEELKQRYGRTPHEI